MVPVTPTRVIRSPGRPNQLAAICPKAARGLGETSQGPGSAGGWSQRTATAPLASAAGIHWFPSVFSPRKAANRPPGERVLVSQVREVISTSSRVRPWVSRESCKGPPPWGPWSPGPLGERARRPGGWRPFHFLGAGLTRPLWWYPPLRPFGPSCRLGQCPNRSRSLYRR